MHPQCGHYSREEAATWRLTRIWPWDPDVPAALPFLTQQWARALGRGARGEGTCKHSCCFLETAVPSSCPLPGPMPPDILLWLAHIGDPTSSFPRARLQRQSFSYPFCPACPHQSFQRHMKRFLTQPISKATHCSLFILAPTPASHSLPSSAITSSSRAPRECCICYYFVKSNKNFNQVNITTGRGNDGSSLLQKKCAEENKGISTWARVHAHPGVQAPPLRHMACHPGTHA